MRGQNLKQLWKTYGARHTVNRLTEALELGRRGDPNGLKPEDFSIRELAESFCGHDWVRRLWEGNSARYGAVSVLEAGEGVDISAFSNITGQLIFSKIQQGWDQIPNITDELFELIPTKLDGEKIPGIGRIKDEGSAIHPGKEYPETSFGEQYWQTPSTTKKGQILSITKELVFFDRTGLILKRGGEIGERLKKNYEKERLDVFAGIINNHVWNGNAFNTYATGANTIGINSLGSTPLVDWTSIETAELLFPDLLDPDTGNPIEIDTANMVLVVMPFKKRTAQRIIKATEFRANSNQSAGTQSNITIGDNPMENEYRVLSSAMLYQRIIASGVTASNAKNWWFLGNPKKAFAWMENWPLTVVQAPPNSTAEFERDIVMRWKGSYRGVAAVQDPRYMVKMYNA